MKHIQIEKREPMYPVGSHLKEAIKYIDNVVKAFDFSKERLINIWCRGSSGSILATLLYQKIKSFDNHITISYVRKPNEQSHSTTDYRVGAFNIIIDDFISFGSTVESIYKEMQAYNRAIPVDLLIVSYGYTEEISFKPKILIQYEKV